MHQKKDTPLHTTQKSCSVFVSILFLCFFAFSLQANTPDSTNAPFQEAPHPTAPADPQKNAHPENNTSHSYTLQEQASWYCDRGYKTFDFLTSGFYVCQAVWHTAENVQNKILAVHEVRQTLIYLGLPVPDQTNTSDAIDFDELATRCHNFKQAADTLFGEEFLKNLTFGLFF